MLLSTRGACRGCDAPQAATTLVTTEQLLLQVHRLDNAICVQVKTRKPRKRAPAGGDQPHEVPGGGAAVGSGASQAGTGAEEALSAQRSTGGHAAGARDTAAAAATCAAGVATAVCAWLQRATGMRAGAGRSGPARWDSSCFPVME